MEYEKLLLSYQQYALQQMFEKKYSIIMWSRQTGKSFVVSLFAVLRAIERKNHLVAIISPTERQSKELMEKVKKHVDFLKELGKIKGDVSFFEDTTTNVLEVRFPNRSRIIGLPANPDGVRGLTGDVILEEAAFFKDGYKVYQAIFPSITRNKDFKLVVISTPRAKSDIFGHLWQMSENNDLWFRQKLTIYDAVNQGSKHRY
jgi:phage FluMu gp28-like protein